MRPLHAAVLVLLACPASLQAGLHYSGETFDQLPSRWRGFLLDQRLLRIVANRPPAGSAPGPARARYEQDAARLVKLSKERKLTADEAADLGAIYVRMGDYGRAVEALRSAQRANPVHFRLAANLGTAWQLFGDLAQAGACLEQAVKLAPGKQLGAEQLHLKLVRARAREGRDARGLDNLFGVRYIGPGGKYEPGRLAPKQRKVLPSAAVALTQQLALWLPADARLLWQLAELANAHGDVVTAAAMLDGCVTEFGLRTAELQAHRRALRPAANARKLAGDREEHERHALPFKPRSSRPLVAKAAPRPAVDPKGVNPLAWEVLAETTVDRRYRPTFARYLKELAGKGVVLDGFQQPIGDDPDLSSFLLIEHPVGCWYCEAPELVNIVLVELPGDKTIRPTRSQLRVTGKLLLNADDPENFFYVIRDAKVKVLE
jgi:hypothetical protein